MTSSREYRRDIDGLRAIAVTAVLLHHLNASVLPGGFVGVDIFFVISGFLITSQIAQEIAGGAFSLRRFYQRRINRIVPALLVVIVASSAAGVLILSPADLVLLGKSAVSALLGLSNIFFWREYGNYFAGKADEAPLLHTWSLGVEEQFYLVWPLTLIVLFKLSHRYIPWILAVLTVGAIVFSELAVGYVASASYYLLPMRFFELMVGGLLGLWRTREPGNPLLARLCFYVGLVLIGASLFWLNRSSSFPGVNALWPCLGAALVIYARQTDGLSAAILANPVMVFIGLISYSLYLWHWPAIAYLNYLDIPISFEVGSLVTGGLVLLSWLSWRFIEIPMRQTGIVLPFSHVLARRFVTPVMALFAVVAITASAKGFPERFDPRVAAFERGLDAKPEILRAGCHVPTGMYDVLPDPQKCRLGADKGGVDAILIGDSYANHFTGMVDVMAKAAGVSVMDYTMDGCPPMLGYMTANTPGYAERCRKRNETTFALLKEGRYSWVILAANWPNSPEAAERLAASVEILLAHSVKVTLIAANESIARANICPIRRVMYGTAEICEQKKQSGIGYLEDIRSRYPAVEIIDPNLIICPDLTCSPTLDGVLLYRDSGHLNDIGSRLVGQRLLAMGIAL